MNKLYNISIPIVSLILLLSFFSCENDNDKIYLTGLESSELVSTTDQVVLTKENNSTYVLGLAWTDNTLVVSNSEMGAPAILKTILQVSGTEDFTGSIVETTESNLSKSYTGADLNALAKSLSLSPDVSNPLYFRLKGILGNNISPKYSQVTKVSVTPYYLDMTKGFILNSDMSHTNSFLFSPESNGLYTGFLGVYGWYNFYLTEGDDTIWGNDGMSGEAFKLSSSDVSGERWNMWFPGLSGCYFMTLDTKEKQWSAQYVESLSIGGDLDVHLTFEQKEVQWIGNVSVSEAKTVQVSLTGVTKLYNYTTGTDDASAVGGTITFKGENNSLTLGTTNDSVSIIFEDAGDYSIVISLKDSSNWTYTVSKL